MIGLDVGTSGVKAAAFGVGAPWCTVSLREYPLLEPAPGQEVQDPDRVLAGCRAALADCVAKTAGAHVLAVSVSTAMHGLMALDATLRPLTPLVTWADSRAIAESRELRRQPGLAAELQALTGAPVHPMTPLTKLIWFARHDPATWRAARWWVGLKEWVLHDLTGELATELSSASGTGLLDMARRAWSQRAIEVCGVDPGRLAPILPTTASLRILPEVAASAGLDPATPVVAGGADGPLANLGSGAIVPGVAAVTLGTSGAVRMAVEHPQVDAGDTLFCYALLDSLWVLGGAISNGGGVLRWAGSALVPDLQPASGVRDDAAVLELAAGVAPGCEGLVMLPYLLSERAPLWDPDLPGAYLGLRRHHTRAHLVRAALEGVCLQMRLVLDSLDEVKPVSVVNATGGVFRSELWRNVMAGMLGRPIRLVGDAEGTARGAGALALLALGRAGSPADALALLPAGDESGVETVEPQAALVTAYSAVRAAVPELVAALDPIAGLFGPPTPG